MKNESLRLFFYNITNKYYENMYFNYHFEKKKPEELNLRLLQIFLSSFYFSIDNNSTSKTKTENGLIEAWS